MKLLYALRIIGKFFFAERLPKPDKPEAVVLTEQGFHDYQLLVRLTATNKVNPHESLEVNHILAGMHPDLGRIVRVVQIMSDSIDIALSSHNRETAESRRELWRKCFRTVASDKSGVLAHDTLLLLTDVVKDAEKRFELCLAVNTAREHLKRAAKLKSERGRRGRLAKARQVIEVAQWLPWTDLDTLHGVEREISEAASCLTPPPDLP